MGGYDESSDDAYYYSPRTKDKGIEDNVLGPHPLEWLVESCPGNRDSDEKEDLREVCGCNDEVATTKRDCHLYVRRQRVLTRSYEVDEYSQAPRSSHQYLLIEILQSMLRNRLEVDLHTFLMLFLGLCALGYRLRARELPGAQPRREQGGVCRQRRNYRHPGGPVRACFRPRPRDALCGCLPRENRYGRRIGLPPDQQPWLQTEVTTGRRQHSELRSFVFKKLVGPTPIGPCVRF